MLNVGLAFLSAFVITYLGIPPVLRVASIRRIFDEPDERKIHKQSIPSLGGVAIFAALFFSILFWSRNFDFEHLRWLMLPAFVIFLQGLKDDIVPIDPVKKIIGQFTATTILIFWGEILIVNLHGFLGIHEVPFIAGVLLTYVTILGLINAFNLIDGVDGLAGSIGVVASMVFGTLFCLAGNYHLGVIAFSLTGALLGFLRYNFSPATIFMGDGGSLVVGLLLSILTVKLINMSVPLGYGGSSPLLALAIMIIPVTDTLRVFIVRMLNGKSPFHADRNHLHHVLLRLGFNHRQVALTLSGISIVFIGLSYLLREVNLTFGVVLIMSLAFLACQGIGFLGKRVRKEIKMPEIAVEKESA